MAKKKKSGQKQKSGKAKAKKPSAGKKGAGKKAAAKKTAKKSKKAAAAKRAPAKAPKAKKSAGSGKKAASSARKPVAKKAKSPVKAKATKSSGVAKIAAGAAIGAGAVALASSGSKSHGSNGNGSGEGNGGVSEEERVALPRVGMEAPDFTLPSSGGATIKLSDFRGKNHVVLFFYPKDDTPGCTVEACGFRDEFGTISSHNAVILGVSPDDVKSHDKFKAKYSLPFPLLADIGAKTAQRYGVWVEKNMYGKRYMGIQRSTILVDKNGRVAAVWPKVQVDGHNDEVIKQLASIE